MKDSIRYLFSRLKQFIPALLPLLVIGSLEVGMALSLVTLSKRVIDVATGSIPGYLSYTIGLITGLLLLSILARISLSWLTVRLKTRAENDLRSYYFARILRTDWLSIRKYHSGDIMSRINTDIADMVSFLTATVPQFFLTSLRLSGAFCYLYVMDSQLALILAAIVPVALGASKLYFRRMRTLLSRIKETSSLVRQFFQEAVQHNMIIKALRLEQLFEQQLDYRQADYFGHVREQNRFSIFSTTVLALGFTAAYLITFSHGLFELQAGAITFGTLTAFIQLLNMIQGPALGLVGLAPTFVAVYTATDRLIELDQLPKEALQEDVHPIAVRLIELKNVSFAYDPGQPVLDRLNLCLARGTITALSGRTGCGKTTLIRLLLALMPPQTGEITLNDGFHAYPVSEQTRINFSYVPQENHLFSGSIRDNLRIGNPQATDEQLKIVLLQTAAQFVFDMPQGLDTLLKEQGEGLSGGQIQRLALARALLYPGCILLLDEVTSALDENTEAEIMQSIRRHLDHRIILIVTHRQKVMDVCDAVFDLETGLTTCTPRKNQTHFYPPGTVAY